MSQCVKSKDMDPQDPKYHTSDRPINSLLPNDGSI
jgi:hypothetical protein